MFRRSPQARPSSPERDLTGQILHAFSADPDAIAVEAHVKLAASRRDLSRQKARLSQPIRPNGCESTLSGAGDRVFGNPGAGRKIPTNIIDRITRRGDQGADRLAERADRFNVRLQSADHLFGLEHCDMVFVVLENLQGSGTERCFEFRGRDTRSRTKRREIEGQPRAVTFHRQRTARRIERDRVACRFRMGEHHVSRGQRRVPAERDFRGRRKPTDRVSTGVAVDERGLGQVVLERDRLHEFDRERIRDRELPKPYPRHMEWPEFDWDCVLLHKKSLLY